MLPDRASPDRSREAGLNGMTSQCTGVPAMRDIPNTSMASGFGVAVKGSCIAPSLREGGLRMGIGNENDQVK